MIGGKEVSIHTDSLLKEIPSFASRGITEFSLHDRKASGDRRFLLAVASAVRQHCPDLFISLVVDVRILDRQLIESFSALYCSVELELSGTEKNGTLLFDKKLYANKTALLNNAGLVFGFRMEWGAQAGDSFKAFRDRLDFAVSLYPNHIVFPQLDEVSEPKSTGIYSSKDMDFSRGIAFACRTFYTAGRAVPWFTSVLKPLKITPSSFFADFDEWQQCNNCSYITGFKPDEAAHKEIEKMQLLFLKDKFEEKHKQSLLPVVNDIVMLNGAFSRVAAENEECVLETSYNPDELLSPYAMDIARFADSVCLEPCRVKVFAAADSPDYTVLR